MHADDGKGPKLEKMSQFFQLLMLSLQKKHHKNLLWFPLSTNFFYFDTFFVNFFRSREHIM